VYWVEDGESMVREAAGEGLVILKDMTIFAAGHRGLTPDP